MRLNTNFRLGLLDKALLVLSSIGAALFSYLLFDQTFIAQLVLSDRGGKLEQIGQFTVSENDVRRRLHSSLVWFNIRGNESLFEGDYIFTGDDSTSTVQLSDGLSLEIAPNSLIIVSRLDNSFAVNLQVGQVVAQSDQAGKTVTVVQEGQKTEVAVSDKGSVKVSRAKPDLELDVRAISGEVSVSTVSRSGERKTETVKKSQSIKFKANQQIERREFLAVLERPKDMTNYWSKENEPIAFKWETEQKTVEVQVAKDRGFSDLVYRQTVQGNSVDVSSLPLDQSYFWRVVGVDENQIADPQRASDANRFKVSLASAPKLIFPPDGYQADPQPQRPLNFLWSERAGKLFYQVEVAKDSEFKNLLANAQLPTTQWSTPMPASGKYFWRVKMVTKSKTEFVSAIHQFEVLVAPEPKPIQPTEVKPEPKPEPKVVEKPWESDRPYGPERPPEVAKTEFEKDKPPVPMSPPQVVLLKFPPNLTSREPAAVKDKILNPPIFEWSPSAAAKFYEFEVVAAGKAKSARESIRADSTKLVWRPIDAGKFQWHVRGVSESGQFTPWSKPEKLDVRLPAPSVQSEQKRKTQVKSPLELIEASDVPVQWPHVPLAQGYRMQLSDQRDFGEWQEIDFRSPSATLNLKTGEHFYRVASLNSQNKVVSEFSPVGAIKVEKELLLDPPRSEYPKRGLAMVSFGDQQSPVVFTWSTKVPIKEFSIQLSEDEEFSKVFLERKVKEKTFVLKDKIPKGKVFWRVRARHKTTESDWTEPAYFYNN